MKLSRLIPKDYPALKPYFKDQQYKLCSYSLPSAIAWSNQEYQPYKTIIDKALVIGCEFSNRKENRHLLLPISREKEYSPAELRNLARELEFSSFWFVPEDYIEAHGKQNVASIFKIAEQAGYHDYIYRTHDLMYLKGNKYSKKRNLIHQFKKKVLSRRDVTIEPMTPASKSECLDFMEKWCEERKCSIDQDTDLACEKEAVANTVDNMEKMDVKGLMLRIDGDISAFGMTSRLTREMGVLHFEKAYSKIKGLYQYFDNICAMRLLADYRFTNKENDMELPGLVKSKKSYHPIQIIRSYRLDLK